MSRNNIKLLTDRQLTELNEKYNFSIDGDNVVVDIKNYNRHTKHPITDSFFINSKIRKITLSPEAISIWIELTQDRLRYTLFDVQNAINKLYLLYQDVTTKNVKQILSGVNLKITKL